MENHSEEATAGVVAAHCPVISESQEAVNLEGVKLFMHSFVDALAGAPLRTSRFTIRPGCGTREDKHEVREVWFISAGTVDVFYDDAWHRVSAGQAVFFESLKPHFATNNGDVEAQIFSVWWG